MSSTRPDNRPGATNPRAATDGRPSPGMSPAAPTRLSAPHDGLSQQEAQARLAQYGYNELPEKKINPLLKFLSYFWGPIPWMIEAAVILSAVVQTLGRLRHHPDLAGGERGHRLLGGVPGGQRHRRFEGPARLTARVKRSGTWKSIPAREVVPGDLIRIRLGDIVPADAQLLEGDPIEVDQSALTGESLPVSRKTGDTVYSGSIVRQGEVDATVTATGQQTYFGKTAKLVETAHTVSHFQRAVLKIGDFLIFIAVALVILIVTVSLFRGDAMLHAAPGRQPVLLFALVLTVAAIPVAMPTVLSVTMAVGARLLARKEAIVSRLVAIEELAGMDVLCSDKTGTLTQNRLTLGEPFAVPGVSPAEVIASAALASRAEDQDPIDLAVLGGLPMAGAQARSASEGTAPMLSLRGCEVTHFQPFDPVHKRTEATVRGSDGALFKVAKGAPQVILALAPDAAQIQPQVEKTVNEFASRGFRSLGVARADGDGPWRFLGVLPLYDPPREDSKPTIATAEQMGVEVKMVTGDQVAIGKEIARQVGLGSDILDASLFVETKTHQAGQLADTIEKADGFAQVFPEHKFHIVEVLQEHGHIVGMTGDGVNDAPALKKADCGIAVSGATDAARAAADIVLLAPGLSVIIDAIKESRKIFQRMNSYAIYRIAETIRVLLFMTLSILVFNFYPVTAVMIVLLALLNDGAILSIAYDRVHYSDRPEAWNMRLVLGLATVLGVFGVFASFGLFYLGERVFHLDRDTIQTLMYLKLRSPGT